MRFLADAGLSPATVEFLIQLGHEAEHVRTLGMQRAPDADIVARAGNDSSVVLTFDLDFGDILALSVFDKPSAIIFRLSDERPASVNQRLGTVLAECSGVLDSGALVLVEDTRYRCLHHSGDVHAADGVRARLAEQLSDHTDDQRAVYHVAIGCIHRSGVHLHEHLIVGDGGRRDLPKA
jgi:predicted nuclease of predicted toxin-antitoxin system